MKNAITPSSSVENLRFILTASSMKAMLGWSIERELVTAARNSRKKNMKPKTHPSGICAKNSGSTLKPRSNRLSPAPITPDIPKNAMRLAKKQRKKRYRRTVSLFIFH